MGRRLSKVSPLTFSVDVFTRSGHRTTSAQTRQLTTPPKILSSAILGTAFKNATATSLETMLKYGPSNSNGEKCVHTGLRSSRCHPRKVTTLFQMMYQGHYGESNGSFRMSCHGILRENEGEVEMESSHGPSNEP